MTEYRSVTDHFDQHFEYGHRESNDGDGWEIIPRSDWVKLTQRQWFMGTPLERMQAVGVHTTIERATEFEQAIDADPSKGYYYLATAMQPAGNLNDEALKWIMGALAAELNARKMSFDQIGRVLPGFVLGLFADMIVSGEIDRTFTKQIFAELLTMDFPLGEDPTERVEALVRDPRFKAVDADALEGIVDQVIAANPDQFEKAKENPKLVQFFVGQVMKATQGKAPAPKVIEIMTERLSA